MHKKSLIFLGVLAVILIIYFLWSFPFMTRVDLTLNAVRVNHEGSVTGYEDIRIQGYKYDYLFQMSRIEVNIAPFDGHTSISADGYHDDSGMVIGAILTHKDQPYQYANYSGWYEPRSSSYFGILAFSPDFDRWIYGDKTNGIYYVASVSGDDSIAELVEYFDWLIQPPI